MIRRIGKPPRADRVYRRRPGAYAVLLRDGAVLLTHQAAPVPEFQLPGGGIDPGEQPIPALTREIFEETGWSAAVARRLGTFRRFTYMPEYDLWAEKICTVYLARPILRRGPPSEPGHAAVWMPPGDAIAAVGNDGDRMFLLRALALG
ncbi:NUDIX hydrolase [Frigidibacter sp. MR17.24]|uniref:NUDIX hydrolase n=1 Tax=Frigidibacter sp. MR17.24 TaxID=3127345 RepID=UPI0030130704